MDADVKVAEPTEEKRENAALKLALEFGPLVVFFFANARGPWIAEQLPWLADLGRLGEPIFIATGTFMIATAIALTLSWILTRTIPRMPLISGIFVFVFGALTLWLQNDIFIKMKPTIVNLLFGSLLLVAWYGFKTSLLKYVFNAAFQIDEEGWAKLTVRWGLFFFFSAVVNEVVWRNFSTDFWVAFKVWGTMPLTITFTLAQIPLLMKHSTEEKDEEEESAA
ncbi:MAG: septation protein A [Pseudomonadota bacterium]